MGDTQNTGTIKFFDSTKGFGFIIQDSGQRDLFVHLEGLQKGFDPKEGDKVEYVIVDGRKGPCAQNVGKI